MKNRKRIGILTSGGDCPGLNAVIRAVVSHATLTYNWEVLGISYATQGLLEGKAMALTMHGLDLRGIDPLLSMGGTILGTINKGDTLARASEIIAGYEALELDALIGIGGDGSINILHNLACQGNWNFVAIPKTIDNDVALTERSVGFDTAVNTITDALNRLTFTAASHDRVMIVEVMGRKAGHLALQAGIAGGADVILIPEIPYSIENVCKHLDQLRDRWGRKFAIIVVAEGIEPIKPSFDCSDRELCKPTPDCGIGQYIADQIAHCSTKKIETRVSVLGHIQRGGIPCALDRLVATAFGKAAVDLVAQGQFDQMVAWQNGQVVAVPLQQVILQSPAPVNTESYLVETARALGIYVGELGKDDTIEQFIDDHTNIL
ncbi:ATP-dependent 6-phosphofructokinase [Scytonema sp. UIC 10036]|uniref:ATP-dependent 6-phosphofructokinase n=1 Tax=Scytonema sp. UIC 10036 TaxID=2304196 RepID=UPI0012DA2285|nr:ATP-dependent 6-phosphofructokinase [Scytonema sp. UIC 10036]MUG99076.1 ATP-dependent 6-phosphofructokinase [Scytonema sp. UIC 10036]